VKYIAKYKAGGLIKLCGEEGSLKVAFSSEKIDELEFYKTQ